MKWWSSKSLEKIQSLMRDTAPSPERLALRLQAVERDIVLPVKAVVVGILLYYLNFSRWFEDTPVTRSVAQDVVERFFLIYLTLNVAMAALLVFNRRLPSPFMQGVILTNTFMDGLFLAALTFVTGGFDSILYWVFLGVIVRNALSVPLAIPQLILNFSASLCYVTAGVLDLNIKDELLEVGPETILETNPAEPFVLRVIVLWLMIACCYGVQVLFEKQRRAAEEAQEASVRQGQLRSAGRLAAQIAHQLKNPLGIINNAAFSLQRSLKDKAAPGHQQLGIIREEVERSDRILTQLMGYAQLAEGRVEKLSLPDLLEKSICEVMPPAGPFAVTVHRSYATQLSPLLMQRSHLSEILVNILLNAREAMEGKGQVWVDARETPDHVLELRISDDGPGIRPENLQRIFSPYFSTKQKGTGLGLAIVKNNLEMYSGTVDVKSELGKGTCFIIRFPTRTIMKEPA